MQNLNNTQRYIMLKKILFILCLLSTHTPTTPMLASLFGSSKKDDQKPLIPVGINQNTLDAFSALKNDLPTAMDRIEKSVKKIAITCAATGGFVASTVGCACSGCTCAMTTCSLFNLALLLRPEETSACIQETVSTTKTLICDMLQYNHNMQRNAHVNQPIPRSLAMDEEKKNN